MDVNDIRADMAHELGCKMEDMLESSRTDVAREDGARAALQAAAKKVAELSSAVDVDLDSGAFQDVDGPLAIAAIVKKFISRACTLLESGATSAESHRLMHQGRVQVLELLVGNMEKVRDMERGKAAVRREAAEHGLPEARGHVAGVAPGLPLKERRRIEEMKPVEDKPKSKKAKGD